MKTHMATEETLQRIAATLESVPLLRELEFNATLGHYEDESVAAFLGRQRDGKAYGVSYPKGSAVACAKIGANAGMADPTPGIVGRAAVDPYVGAGPFVGYDVNAIVGSDGRGHVTAIEGDGNFKRDGSNGNVFRLVPVLYEKWNDLTDRVEHYISDTALAGMEPNPQAYLPDGTMRPFMLTAKYPMGKDSGGDAASISGVVPWVRDVSHNSLITQCKNATTGYSGKSIYDDWYAKTMIGMKYATKDIQTVFAGCTSYNLNYAVTVAEEDAERVIISKASAANLLVGSYVTLGSADHSNSVLGGTRILSIEDYDEDNSAVNLDVAAAFTTTTSLKLSTSQWACGCLDDVEGDGTITDDGRTSGKEPFKVQGIELMLGAYEILGDVILAYDGTNGAEICICYDSRNASTSVTSDYTHTEKYLYADATTGWHYPMYPDVAGGLPFGAGNGGSNTTGLADGHYMLKVSTTGNYEWLGWGNLSGGRSYGPWCVIANSGLTNADWYIGSRLSATGRSRPRAA